jgi:magnesium-protoporphyrin O-methyltransferase
MDGRDTTPIASFFDREACCATDAPTGYGPTGISEVLLGQLRRLDLEGWSVLELGCGLGSLTFELLRSGASRATGVDLSPASIERAAERARGAGLADRARFVVGDAATVDVEAHDLVVLDKVICCYPDVEALLAGSVPKARRAYALSLPSSRGLRGIAARMAFWAENVWRWVKRDPFRSHVHDLDRIEPMLAEHGFAPRSRVHRLIWHVAVHERPAA